MALVAPLVASHYSRIWKPHKRSSTDRGDGWDGILDVARWFVWLKLNFNAKISILIL